MQEVRAADVKSRQSDLARVAVLQYQNQTGSNNFSYLSASLSDAIQLSLRFKFEYLPANKTELKAGNEILRRHSGEIDAFTAERLLKQMGVDILVLGSFAHDKGQNRLSIKTHVAIAGAGTFRTLRVVSNRVDGTIFRAVDAVASDILGDLSEVAMSQHQVSEKSKISQKGKTKLTKPEQTFAWKKRNWLISIETAGILRIPDSTAQSASLSPAVYLGASRRVFSPFFAGISAGYLPLRTQIGTQKTILTAQIIDFEVTGAYTWNFAQQWVIITQLGAGYYFGTYEKTPTCLSTTCANGSQGKIANPSLSLQVGINYLLFYNVSVGASAAWRMLYDSPQSLQALSLGLSCGWVF